MSAAAGRGMRRRRGLVAMFALTLPGLGSARPGASLVAPNVVAIHDRLVTSGQPHAGALSTLGTLGFEAVVYLAPSSVADAVAAEPALLERQGITFVHIPIPFDRPEPAHFRALAAALDRLRARRVLVHCQVNLRASTLVFLYRAIVLKEDPAVAYEAVARVWSPQGPWRSLASTLLREHGIAFELY